MTAQLSPDAAGRTIDILVVDDDDVDRMAVQRALTQSSLKAHVRCLTNAEEALISLSETAVDCLLLDYELPPTNALAVLQQLQQRGILVPVVVLTGHGNEQLAVDVMRAGATDYISKAALSPERLATAVTNAIKLYRSQRETARAQEELQQQLQFAELLIGVVSHDLRNPLNTIHLSAHYLDRRPELSNEAKRTVARIRQSSQRAIRLILDLLDFTQVRAGRGMPIQRAAMDLYDTATAIVDEFAISYPDRKFNLSAKPGALGSWDADRIAQVLTNLISNAVAYGSPEAPIDIRVISRADAVEVQVANAGQPIPNELLPLLFEPLRRLTAVQSTASGNIGLGLYIVEQIAKSHGGTVDVNSNHQQTVFTVRLPTGSGLVTAVV